MATITKRELVIKISNETGLTQQQVFDVIQKTLDSITDSLSNGDTVTRNEFYNLYSEGTPAIVPPAAGGPASMPNSILNPLVGKMEITSDIYDEVMSTVDKQLILRALESSNGKIREAARRLGLARNTLKSKIQKYNIAVRE